MMTNSWSQSQGKKEEKETKDAVHFQINKWKINKYYNIENKT